MGVVSDKRWSVFEHQQADIKTARRLLEKFVHSPQGWATLGYVVKCDGVVRRYGWSSSKLELGPHSEQCIRPHSVPTMEPTSLLRGHT